LVRCRKSRRTAKTAETSTRTPVGMTTLRKAATGRVAAARRTRSGVTTNPNSRPMAKRWTARHRPRARPPPFRSRSPPRQPPLSRRRPSPPLRRHRPRRRQRPLCLWQAVRLWTRRTLIGCACAIAGPRRRRLCARRRRASPFSMMRNTKRPARSLRSLQRRKCLRC
jgi:hypothetical protein